MFAKKSILAASTRSSTASRAVLYYIPARMIVPTHPNKTIVEIVAGGKLPDLQRYHFRVPPTRLEKPDATVTAPSTIFRGRDGKGRGAGPSITAAPFLGS